jgi:hypothetical protein
VLRELLLELGACVHVCAFATTSVLIRWNAAMLPGASYFDAWTRVCALPCCCILHNATVWELQMPGHCSLCSSLEGKEARFARCVAWSVAAGMHLLLLLRII